MDREQAKEILSLYRPWAPDQQDTDLAQALDLAKRDPQLAHWLAEHCALQEAIRAKFRETSVPEGLMEQILSERKAHLSRTRQRKVVLAAAIAGIMFGLLGIARFYWPSTSPTQDNTFIAFRQWTAGTVIRQYPKMDLETTDLAQIQQALQKHAQGDYKLPQALVATTPTGCATNLPKWNGHPVSMICFNSGKNSDPTQPDLFLFITDRSAVAGAPALNSLQLANFMKLATASWSEGDKIYVLGALGDEEFIRKYF